jgi:hypothetical protein
MDIVAGVLSNTCLSEGKKEDKEDKPENEKFSYKAEHAELQKKMMNKAFEHYEKGEHELGKKFKGLANKFAEDCVKGNPKLADYETNELSAEDDDVKELSKGIKKLSAAIENCQDDILSIKLSVQAKPETTSLSQRIDTIMGELTKLKESHDAK